MYVALKYAWKKVLDYKRLKGGKCCFLRPCIGFSWLKGEVNEMTSQARIDALKNAPPNGWVAFTEDEERFVAYASTYDEAVELAERNGVSDPVIVKVPENWNDRVLAF